MESKKSGSFKKIELNLFYNLPLPATLSSPEGVRIDVNEPALKLYKRSKKEWIGAELEEMYEKTDAPKIKKAIEHCRKTGYSSCEVTAIRGDGVKFPAILNFSTLKDKEGNI
ncbi:MAG TPA: PAS domain-containing protein, partial [Thermoplasmata archaeon]|nr:PAS domain-containing protein [Thermoplasmata archaeon]